MLLFYIVPIADVKVELWSEGTLEALSDTDVMFQEMEKEFIWSKWEIFVFQEYCAECTAPRGQRYGPSNIF